MDVLRESSANTCPSITSMDPRVDRMLWHLEDDSKRNVVEELIFDFDIEEIMEAREALFNEIISGRGMQDGAGLLENSTTKGMRPIAVPWKPIKRRVSSIAADDLCDLYLYKLDPTKGFPYKMLRRRVLCVASDEHPPDDRLPDEITETEKGPISVPEIVAEFSEPMQVVPEKMGLEEVSDYALTLLLEIISQIRPKSMPSLSEIESDHIDSGKGNDSGHDSGTDKAQALPSMEHIDPAGEGFPSGNFRVKPPKTVDVAAVELPSNADDYRGQTPQGTYRSGTNQAGFWETGPNPKTPSYDQEPTVRMQISPVTKKVEQPLVHMQNRGDPYEKATSETGTCESAHSIEPTAAASITTIHATDFCFDIAKHTAPRTVTNPTPANPTGKPSNVLQANSVSAKTCMGIESSTPRQTREAVRLDKSTATVSEMATQTGPNEIYDPPIKKSEFTGQMDYIDTSLIDHERRLRANEMRCERSDAKVNKIDSDIFTMYADLRASHETLIDDHNNLKQVVADILKASPLFENLITGDAPPQRQFPAETASRSSSINVGNLRENPLVDLTDVANAPPPVQYRNAKRPETIQRPPMRLPCTQQASCPPVQPANTDTPDARPDPPNMYTDSSATGESTAVKPSRPADPPSQSKGFDYRQGPTQPHVKVPDNSGLAKRNPDKKRPENPADIFLKEARKVIPAPLPRRTPKNSHLPRKTNNDKSKMMTSTPGTPHEPAQGIAISNMFGVLESQEGTNHDAPDNLRQQFSSRNPPINLESPEDFPSLPPPMRMSCEVAPPTYRPNGTCQQPPIEDHSWAEIDDEENRTIEAFMATVENGTARGAMGGTEPDKVHNDQITPMNPAKDKHSEYMAARGIKPAPIKESEPLLNLNKPQRPTQVPQKPKIPPFGAQNQGRAMQQPKAPPAGAMSQEGAIRPNNGPNFGARPKYGPQSSGGTQSIQRGDKPKSMSSNPTKPQSTKGNPMNSNQTNVNATANESGRLHTDRVVTRNGWFTDNKKRKRTKSSPLTYPAISGGHTKPYRDVFVRNLKTENYNDPEEMADALQDYCEEREIDVYFVRILNSQFEGYANVRMTVATSDYETVIGDDFWPENISAREWYPGKEKKVAREGQNN